MRGTSPSNLHRQDCESGSDRSRKPECAGCSLWDSALPESNNQNLQNLLRAIRVIRGSFVVRQEKAIHELHELHEVDFEDSGC